MLTQNLENLKFNDINKTIYCDPFYSNENELTISNLESIKSVLWNEEQKIKDLIDLILEYSELNKLHSNTLISKTVIKILLDYKKSNNREHLFIRETVKRFLKEKELNEKVILLEDEKIELEKAALIDPLTKLANRRLIDEEMKKHTESKTRLNIETSIIIIDIDLFKKINDTFWHKKWDEVLVEISKILKKFFRLNDVIWRWWWEEFLIIMPNISIEEAFKKAEYIRKKVESTLTKNTWLTKMLKPITISMWITQLLEWETTWTHAEQRADKALYASKHSGRNKVTIYNPSMDEDNAA